MSSLERQENKLPILLWSVLCPPPEIETAPQTGPSQLSDSWALARLGKPIPVHTGGNSGPLILAREFLSHTCKCSDTHTMASNSPDTGCHLCTRPRWLNRVTEGSEGSSGGGDDCQMLQFFQQLGKLVENQMTSSVTKRLLGGGNKVAFCSP